jgi:type IV secretory pathway VirB4 component
MVKYNLSLGFIAEDLNQELPEFWDIKERFEHTYIVGKTGMGKSSLLEHMAEYDINKDLAVIFIDPKGETCKKLYSLTKDKSRIRYISIESPTIINPLNKEGYKLDNLIQEFIQILDVLVTLTASNPESTVLMREIINRAMHSIIREQDKNLDYLTRFLLYSDVRQNLKNTMSINSELRKYWDEFDGIKGKIPRNSQKVECAQRLASRLIEISTGEMKNFVVGKNELDMTDIVQNNKVVLVDTSHMNRNSRIYLTNLIVYSILSYCDFAKEHKNPLLVYVDEFQIVVSDFFSDLLARSRGSKVGFTLSHQNFQQIPKSILGSIFGNVGTSICFRCGDEEAKRFAPIFSVKSHELFNLPKYNAWVRIGTNNTLIETYPPKLSEISQMEITPKKETTKYKLKQAEIPFTQEEFNFLSDEWVNY